jgi:hypothetical protein
MDGLQRRRAGEGICPELEDEPDMWARHVRIMEIILQVSNPIILIAIDSLSHHLTSVTVVLRTVDRGNIVRHIPMQPKVLGHIILSLTMTPVALSARTTWTNT